MKDFTPRTVARQSDSQRRRQKRDLDRRRAARHAELAKDHQKVAAPSYSIEDECRCALAEVDDPERRAKQFDDAPTDAVSQLNRPLIDGDEVSRDVLGRGGEWDTRDIVRDAGEIDADPEGFDVVDTPRVEEFGGEF